MKSKQEQVDVDVLFLSETIYEAVKQFYKCKDHRMTFLYDLKKEVDNLPKNLINQIDEIITYENITNDIIPLIPELEDMLKEIYDEIQRSNTIAELKQALERANTRAKFSQELKKYIHNLVQDTEMCPECLGDMESDIVEEDHPYGDTTATEYHYNFVCTDCGCKFEDDL